MSEVILFLFWSQPGKDIGKARSTRREKRGGRRIAGLNSYRIPTEARQGFSGGVTGPLAREL